MIVQMLLLIGGGLFKSKVDETKNIDKISTVNNKKCPKCGKMYDNYSTVCQGLFCAHAELVEGISNDDLGVQKQATPVSQSPADKSSLAGIALTLAMVSIIPTVMGYSGLGLIFAIIAIVLGIMGLNTKNRVLAIWAVSIGVLVAGLLITATYNIEMRYQRERALGATTVYDY